MASVDLLFSKTQLTQPAALVFGEGESLTDYEVALAVTFPLSFAANVVKVYEANVAVTFPLSFAAEAAYSSNTARPLVGQVVSPFQNGTFTEAGVQDSAQPVAQVLAGVNDAFNQGLPIETGAKLRFQGALRLGNYGQTVRHQDAMRLGTETLRSGFSSALRDRRHSVRTGQQDASPIRASAQTDWQDRYRDRRPSLSSEWRAAQRLHRAHSGKIAAALPLDIRHQHRHKEAMRPPPGLSPLVPPPVGDPCYLPDPNLLFNEFSAADGNLVFFCERHDDGGPAATVVVPIRRVYVVINNIFLRRVVGNVSLPALSLSMSIDADSWTWAFSAVLPAASLVNVQRDPGEPPVELEANINGNLYRILAENITSSRSFGQHTINVTGRGKSAFLTAPYAPVLTFANSIERTAQQLMADVLQFNNIPIGWDVDWQIDDWLVPAGAFGMQGTYIDGLNAIAGAAGAYLQPHPTLQEMKVLLRYPVKPWAWDTVTPDFELPSAVTIQEGIEWVDRANYNGVYVSGTSQGIRGLVFKEGTSSEPLAPMVTDPLITATNAARQRGLAILGNTGRKAMLNLRLPILPATGVIAPGKFVRYTDPVAGNKIGLVRSVSVEARLPEATQSLIVETHLS